MNMCVRNVHCVALLLLCLGLVACSKKAEEKPAVATVGQYRLGVADYRRALGSLSESEKSILSTSKGKQALLNQLIDRQVLVQQAQKLNIHQDKQFMSLVEDFWVQAMIEELIIRKTEDLLQQTSVNQSEVDHYYRKMLNKVHARIRIIEGEQLAKKVYADQELSFEEIEQIKEDSGWQMFNYEEVDPAYRDVLFAMNEGDKELMLSPDQSWLLFEVKDIGERELPDIQAIQTEIAEIIIKEKELMHLDKWIDDLRAQLNVSINHDLLKRIDVE